ncbi:MAG: Fic family protein [Rickettsiales bacterium]|jgi:Fic family protein
MNLQSLNITAELLRLISEIDEFKGGWSAVNDQSPERLKALRRVATIESIGSSTRIEGSKLNDAEVESLLGKISQNSFLTRDQQEVAGYSEVMEMVFENSANIPLTDNFIKQLHATLLRHSKKDDWHLGEYKKHSNSVEAFDSSGKSLGVVFETSPAFDTPRLMSELLSWTREALADKSYHPLIVTAVFNVVFLAIHPFQDGNGRLSRVLVSLLLLKSGYHYIPYSSLESVIEKNKESYYLALQRTQKTLDKDQTDWIPWLRFFLTSLKRQKDHLISKTSNLDKYASLPHESMLIMQYVDANHRIMMKDAQAIINTISRPTIKNRFTDLVKKGLLVKNGKARGTWYSKA